MFDCYWAILNRKILKLLLANLDDERSAYVHTIVEKIEKNPRAERTPNLILKETVPFLPTYLEPDLLIEKLLTFVRDNKHAMNQNLYSREYVGNLSVICKFIDKFVVEILESTLEKFNGGKINTDREIYRVSWPFTNIKFTFVDLDET